MSLTQPNQLKANEKKYTPPAIILHWIIACLIIILLPLGLYMVELPADAVPSVRKPWFELHKSLGISVFLLMLIRVFWRITHRPPAFPETTTHRQKQFIAIVHIFFYISMLLQPISGYLSSTFSGYKTKIFGIKIPHWGWKNEELNNFFSGTHEVSAIILFGFILIHLLGVISHQLKGNGKSIIQRMLP